MRIGMQAGIDASEVRAIESASENVTATGVSRRIGIRIGGAPEINDI